DRESPVAATSRSRWALRGTPQKYKGGARAAGYPRRRASGPLLWRVFTADLLVTVEQAMPVRFAEAFARQTVGHLFQGAAQTHEIAVPPQSVAAQLTAVEVDQVDLGILVQEDVVRVEVGVADTEIVEATDAAPYGNPGQNGQRTLAEALGERSHGRQSLRDDVARISQTVVLIACRKRRRNRQPRPMQSISELPLDERTRDILALPVVSITGESCHQAATPVVTQDETPSITVDVVRKASTLSRSLDRSPGLPVFRIEPGGAQIAHPGAVI